MKRSGRISVFLAINPTIYLPSLIALINIWVGLDWGIGLEPIEFQMPTKFFYLLKKLGILQGN